MIRRIAAFLIGASLVAAALAALDFGWLQLDTRVAQSVGTQNQSVSNVVQARPLSLVCPGAAFVEASKSSLSAKFRQLGTSQVSINQNGVAEVQSSTGQVTVSANPGSGATDQGSSLLNATQTQSLHAAPDATSAGANGLISTECQRPSSDFWFVGADTSVGRQSLLVVTNSSNVNATFDLELFGESGAIQAAGMQGLSVASGATLVLPLASFAPSNPALTIHVASQGGAVAAWVQQKTVRGTVSAGIDLISPVSGAGLLQVVPGFDVYGSKAAAAIRKINPDYGDLEPVLRVFAPKDASDSEQTIEVTVLVSGINAKTFGTVVRQNITVGQTTDIPISGLADGQYSAVVTAQKPLFAAMRVSRSSVDQARVLKPVGSDFTWIASNEPITTNRTIVAPDLGSTQLNLVNANASENTVSLTVNGSPKTLLMAANSLSSILLKPGSLLTISASSPIFANLTTVEDAGISSLKILDSKNLGGTVSVSLR